MSYQQEVEVATEPVKAFSALTKGVELWWGKTDRKVSRIGDEFTIYFGKSFWSFRIIEYAPNKTLIWECIDGQPDFNKEWLGTTLHWNIDRVENRTRVSFIHHGLTPKLPCYDICSSTWDKFITTSLKNYLENGMGMAHL